MTPLTHWAVELVVKGVPFVERGRDAEGLDCWGVIWLAYKECFGIELPSYTEHYDTIKDFDRLREIFDQNLHLWNKLEPGTEAPGDVVLMDIAGRPIHVGLVLRKGEMLHIEKNINLCVERYNGTGWKNRVIGVYRHTSR